VAREARAAGIPTDGDTIEVGDAVVTICPWWDGPLGREALDRRLLDDAARRGRRWIWVYHWPPMGSPTCWTGQRHYGDEDLVGWIDRHRPDLVLAGHVHQPPFRADGAWADRIEGTWVFNPGQQRGPLPPWIELDLDAGTATWTSLMGREELRLDEPPPPAPHGLRLSTPGRGRAPSPAGPGVPVAFSLPSTSATISRPGVPWYWLRRSAR
jgi:hypothetical protein